MLYLWFVKYELCTELCFVNWIFVRVFCELSDAGMSQNTETATQHL